MFGLLKRAKLEMAVVSGDSSAVKAALAKGIDLNAPLHRDGANALHLAIAHRHYDVAALLIASGADVNARGPAGYMPLHVAALHGNAEVAKALIAKGADVNAKDNNGGTPLHAAAQMDNPAVAETLIENGCDINARMPTLKRTAVDSPLTPLFVAEVKGNHAVAAILRRRGAKPSV